MPKSYRFPFVWKSLAAFVIYAAPAFSITLTQTFIGSQQAPGNQFQVAQFNPAWGMLNSVNVSEQVSFSGSLTYTNSSGTLGFFNGFGRPDFLLTSSAGDNFDLISGTEVTFDDSVGPHSSFTETWTAQGVDAFFPDTAGYSGTGSVTVNVFSSHNLFEFHDPSLSLTGFTFGPTPYDIVVTYEVSGVPEPSFGLPLVLVTGLFLLRRRIIPG